MPFDLNLSNAEIINTFAWWFKAASVLYAQSELQLLKFDEVALAYVQLWNYAMNWLFFGPSSAALSILWQLPLLIWFWFSFDGQFGIL